MRISLNIIVILLVSLSLVLSAEDSTKTSSELYEEALISLTTNPLEARSKLQLAIKKNPKNISAYNLLSFYYLQQVGHFRLAYKYSMQAERLIYKQYGAPPYSSFQAVREHSEQLRNVSSILQNLDRYQEGLIKLKEYESYGYYDPYLESSKAWIYFKLKDFKQGIEAAKSGLSRQRAIGANLNILGILYSVSGQNEKAIETLKQAYLYELALGASGQISTPLNNVGEVYRESFRELEAVNSWELALQQPDGCDNILPSYNLATVNLEALQTDAAQLAIDNFKKCFANFTLRNDEEHKAVQHLIQARIFKYQGQIDQALIQIKLASEKQQWFGKIGTDPLDLQTAIYLEFAELLSFQLNHQYRKVGTTILSQLKLYIQSIPIRLKREWFYHQAKILLIEQLDHFEDRELRHTDSMLDYSSLGTFYSRLPSAVRDQLIQTVYKQDSRKPAKFYYQAYHAIANNDLLKIKSLLKISKRKFDLNIRLQLLSQLAIRSPRKEQSQLTEKIFELAPAFIPNHGLSLAVFGKNIPRVLRSDLKGSNLRLTEDLAKNYKIQYRKNNEQHSLELYRANRLVNKTTTAKLTVLAKQFIKETFTNGSKLHR